MKKLFCFDFDNTLVKGHFHSQLTNQWIAPVTNNNTLVINGTIQDGNQNEQYDAGLVKANASKLLKNTELGIQDPEGLKSLFNNILSSGHKIAITSFTKYPDVIAVMLNHLALTPEQIKDINIIGGFPKDGPRAPNRKTEHIESAMYLAGVHDKHNVVLIDDSKDNIENAKQQGIQTVHVAKGRADWSVVQGMVAQNRSKSKNIIINENLNKVKEIEEPVLSIRGKIVSAIDNSGPQQKKIEVVIGKKHGLSKFLATILFLKKEKVLGIIDEHGAFLKQSNLNKNAKKLNNTTHYDYSNNTEVNILVTKHGKVIAIQDNKGQLLDTGGDINTDKGIKNLQKHPSKSALKNEYVDKIKVMLTNPPPIPQKSQYIQNKYTVSSIQASHTSVLSGRSKRAGMER